MTSPPDSPYGRQPARVSPHARRSSADRLDLEWARGRVTRAHTGATVGLYVAAAGGIVATLASVSLHRFWMEATFTAVYSAVIFAVCLVLRRSARTYLADPIKLGRQSWRKITMLLWTTLISLVVLSVATLVHLAITGELTLMPLFGAALAGGCLAGPAGALLDASRVTTLVTGR